ncbi:MAG TPA: hypothetical protein VM686_35330, partial [Polyangiaceae bacterium]|nr:hypothetical protein [Polyangiaceae bacterium]
MSCGSDEATGDGDGGGGTLDGGGSGGMEGGVVRDADSAATTGDLGAACITDAECGDGMICITRDNVDTLGGAPPSGLCTAACPCEETADGLICSDDVCLEHSANAYCVPFTTGDTGYCLEGCAMDQGLTPKCHDRIEFVCT